MNQSLLQHHSHFPLCPHMPQHLPPNSNNTITTLTLFTQTSFSPWPHMLQHCPHPVPVFPIISTCTNIVPTYSYSLCANSGLHALTCLYLRQHYPHHVSTWSNPITTNPVPICSDTVPNPFSHPRLCLSINHSTDYGTVAKWTLYLITWCVVADR